MAGAPGSERSVARNALPRHHRDRAPDVHLNLNVRGMGPSATVAINERSNALRRRGQTVYKLGLGQSPFPVPTPVVEELQMWAWRKEYLPVEGLWELREAVANYHNRMHNLKATPRNVLVGPGSKELMFLLQVVYYGDLLIPTPAWVSYAPQAQIVGRKVLFLPTCREDGWKLNPYQLERACRDDPDRPRILVLNYPSNPTGGTYSREELRALAGMARRYRLVLLSDEIYGDLHHQGHHISVARYYPEGTIISTGLSKWCGAGGWRLGTFTFPPDLDWLLQAMASVASETYTSTSTPIQCAAVRAFERGPEIEAYLGLVRRILSALGQAVYRRLTAAGIQVEPPAGAFYLFPDFSPFAESLACRGITTSPELCEALLEDTGVAILPGSSFGRSPAELTARLAYVDFDGQWALAAASELPPDHPIGEDFVQTYAKEVLAAIDRLCDWVTA